MVDRWAMTPTGYHPSRRGSPGPRSPAFGPRLAPAPEGDGYPIALVYRAATGTSELLILNSQDIAGAPAAVLKMPQRVAAGFHGLVSNER